MQEGDGGVRRKEKGYRLLDNFEPPSLSVTSITDIIQPTLQAFSILHSLHPIHSHRHAAHHAHAHRTHTHSIQRASDTHKVLSRDQVLQNHRILLVCETHTREGVDLAIIVSELERETKADLMRWRASDRRGRGRA